jgi:membrane-bound lytic murein transglycosylase D
MQIIINLSKQTLIAALMCTLLINWYSSETEVFHLTPYALSTGTDESQSVWSDIRDQFQLDDRAQSPQVQAEIHKLLADQGQLSNILKAAGPYIYFIHQQTQSRGLPSEIALIPVIESEFNPNNKSNKGASGLWQLMTQTAHDLGVSVQGGYDGRKNVIASTKAALAYFKDLGTFFNNNWYLAIAAYNCGQYKVKSVMKKTGSDSFWNLPLPQETKLYVPKLLAVAAIVKNPEKYGVELPPISDTPYFTQIQVDKPVSLDTVAKTAGVSIDTLNKLNPDLARSQQPANASTGLLVPVDKAPIIKAEVAGT